MQDWNLPVVESLFNQVLTDILNTRSRVKGFSVEKPAFDYFHKTKNNFDILFDRRNIWDIDKKTRREVINDQRFTDHIEKIKIELLVCESLFNDLIIPNKFLTIEKISDCEPKITALEHFEWGKFIDICHKNYMRLQGNKIKAPVPSGLILWSTEYIEILKSGEIFK